MRTALPLLALVALSVSAFAQDAQAPKDEAPAEAEAPVVEKEICKNVRADVSTRRTERICMTKKEWREYERSARR